MSSPFSLSAMTRQPAVIVYDTGPIAASSVSGRLTLGIISDGRWAVKGSLIDGAQFVGDQYEATIGVNFRDPAGGFFAHRHIGVLGGHVAGGTRRSDWEKFGESAFIRDNWDAIRANGFSAVLSVRDSVGQIFQLVGAGVLIAAVVVAGAAGGKTHWETKPDGSPRLVVPIEMDPPRE